MIDNMAIKFKVVESGFILPITSPQIVGLS